MRSGDLLLQIGRVDVSSMGSEEVAQELRLAGSKVRLLIARETDDGDLSPPITRQQDTQVRRRQVLKASAPVCLHVLYIHCDFNRFTRG